MSEGKLDLLKGTLDLLVLQTLSSMGPMHGYGIARRLVDLLSVGDASERSVLPTHEHAGVQHHGVQEASLTIRETERHDRSSALDRRRYG